MSLDPVALVVLGWVGANVSGGAGKYLQDRVYDRLKRTFEKAELKSYEEIEAPDRVKAKVFTEASFTDDDLTLEYLAGVLAGSKRDRDDGAAIVAQIGRLAADQLLFHYLAYREVWRLWPDRTINLYQQSVAGKAGVRLVADDLVPMFTPARVNVVIPTLVREGLLADSWRTQIESIGGRKVWTAQVRPTALGAEFFLWGLGVRFETAKDFLDPYLSLPLVDGIPDTDGTTLINPPDPETLLDPWPPGS